jgi:hypothetical protein
MPMTLDDLYTQVMALPNESKESLAERLVAYLEAHPDPVIERAHLDVAKRRRDEVRLGKVTPLDGEAVLASARQIAGR